MEQRTGHGDLTKDILEFYNMTDDCHFCLAAARIMDSHMAPIAPLELEAQWHDM